MKNFWKIQNYSKIQEGDASYRELLRSISVKDEDLHNLKVWNSNYSSQIALQSFLLILLFSSALKCG